MPTVHFAGHTVECLYGSNLRMVLLRARLPLYNSIARALNCRGYGTCGTCAVRIEGKVSDLTTAERMRLEFPPHEREAGLRLACQCCVLGDLVVTKYSGVWGTRGDSAEPKSPRGR
ncbi:MAG TPA: 2Fe-2S iron-sulfur cluster-binding protein [Myxococcota bacterium]|nr:2Fe-2S iron-sulfur cluster-binding protein [Myxococcota bacterium]